MYKPMAQRRPSIWSSASSQPAVPAARQAAVPAPRRVGGSSFAQPSPRTADGGLAARNSVSFAAAVPVVALGRTGNPPPFYPIATDAYERDAISEVYARRPRTQPPDRAAHTARHTR